MKSTIALPSSRVALLWGALMSLSCRGAPPPAQAAPRPFEMHVCAQAMRRLSACEPKWPTIDNLRFEKRHRGLSYEEVCRTLTRRDIRALLYGDPYASPLCIIGAPTCQQVAQCSLYPEAEDPWESPLDPKDLPFSPTPEAPAWDSPTASARMPVERNHHMVEVAMGYHRALKEPRVHVFIDPKSRTKGTSGAARWATKFNLPVVSHVWRESP